MQFILDHLARLWPTEDGRACCRPRIDAAGGKARLGPLAFKTMAPADLLITFHLPNCADAPPTMTTMKRSVLAATTGTVFVALTGTLIKSTLKTKKRPKPIGFRRLYLMFKDDVPISPTTESPDLSVLHEHKSVNIRISIFVETPLFHWGSITREHPALPTC
ncbi:MULTISPECIES: hypothetical protein [unclassified Pseudomonas]|uniref:hypothetical protein n=1 Tax=unclassified Pseudomonas TaxID=196821 RepID=UPI00298C3819|nr:MULTISPECIES: hypothetical protein [unclassified Pseudomonas]